MAGIDPADGLHAKLVVTAPPIVCEPPFSKVRPRDMWAAQFSAPHAITMAVFGLEPGPDWFVDDWLHDEIAGRFQDSIELRPHTSHASHRGAHAASAWLQLRDGQSFERHVDVAEGEAVTPCRNRLEGKFCDLRARSWETAVLAKRLITCTRWIRRDRSGRSFAYWSADTGIYRHDAFCSQAKPATAINTLGTGVPTVLPLACIATSAKACGQPNSPVIRCAPACPPRPKSTSATCRTAATTADATDLGSI